MIRTAAVSLLFVSVVLSVSMADAQPARRPNRDAAGNPQEPGWAYPILADENQQQIIENTPIPFRPYRPGHFYGNTVRRLYYRGRIIPAPRDAVNAAAAVTLRRNHVGEYVGYPGR